MQKTSFHFVQISAYGGLLLHRVRAAIDKHTPTPHPSVLILLHNLHPADTREFIRGDADRAENTKARTKAPE